MKEYFAKSCGLSKGGCVHVDQVAADTYHISATTADADGNTPVGRMGFSKEAILELGKIISQIK